MALHLLLIIIILWLSSLTFASPPIIVTRLPDGISVSGGDPLRQIVASWDIFVTLEPPPYPDQLAAQVEALDKTFQALNALTAKGFHIDLHSHSLRRDRLQHILRMDAPARRTKRGLFDFGGSILHTLFGVATSDQLKRFQSAMQEIHGHQRDMSHAYTSLATVVNQTRAYTRQLVLHQRQLEIHVVQLEMSMARLAKSVQEQARQIHRLRLMTELDRYLDVLDLAAHHYRDQLTLFNRQRSGLELGHLTRDLLSEDQLTDILNQASTQQKVIDSTSWYYQFLTVTPLWRKTNSLLYRIELPLIAPRPYLLYHILTHPVPISNSSFVVHLSLKPTYAIDTVSGNLFVPHKCIGNLPTVCLTGPEYSLDQMQCARGIITNRISLINTCKVSLAPAGDAPLVSTIDLNQYAIATLGEVLTVRCPGSPETHLNLPQGTHNVTCLRPCTLTGAGFTITCVDRLFLARTFSMKVVRVMTSFNFSDNVHINDLNLALPQMQKLHAGPIDDIDVGWLLNPVPSPTSAPPPVTSRPSLFALINLICILFIVITLSALYIKHRLSRHRRRPTHNGQPELGESIPLALPPTSPRNDHTTGQTPHVDTPFLPTARIWPVLPTLEDCSSNAPCS